MYTGADEFEQLLKRLRLRLCSCASARAAGSGLTPDEMQGWSYRGQETPDKRCMETVPGGRDEQSPKIWFGNSCSIMPKPSTSLWQKATFCHRCLPQSHEQTANSQGVDGGDNKWRHCQPMMPMPDMCSVRNVATEVIHQQRVVVG